MAFSPTGAEQSGWQDRAVDRTVPDTRARDVERMERCIAAARELERPGQHELRPSDADAGQDARVGSVDP